MQVEKVIKTLQEFQKEYGNIDVEIYMEDIDGTQCGLDEINEINISTDKDGLNPAIYIAHVNEKEEE